MRVFGISIITILVIVAAYYLGSRNALGQVFSAVSGLGS